MRQLRWSFSTCLIDRERSIFIKLSHVVYSNSNGLYALPQLWKESSIKRDMYFLRFLYKWNAHKLCQANSYTKLKTFVKLLWASDTTTRSLNSLNLSLKLQKNQDHDRSFSESITSNSRGTVWELPSRVQTDINVPKYLFFIATPSTDIISKQ